MIHGRSPSERILDLDELKVPETELILYFWDIGDIWLFSESKVKNPGWLYFSWRFASSLWTRRLRHGKNAIKAAQTMKTPIGRVISGPRNPSTWLRVGADTEGWVSLESEDKTTWCGSIRRLGSACSRRNSVIRSKEKKQIQKELTHKSKRPRTCIECNKKEWACWFHSPLRSGLWAYDFGKEEMISRRRELGRWVLEGVYSNPVHVERHIESSKKWLVNTIKGDTKHIPRSL